MRHSANVRCRHWILLALLGPSLVAVACDEGSPGEPSALVAPQSAPPHVSYAGPRGNLVGRVLLRATARPKGARVVAVTFTLDGHALGSDTTPPYGLDVDAGSLRGGRHRLRVHAVDAYGRRNASRPVTVTTRPGRAATALSASPRKGLARALAALEAGRVTVHLRRGRYSLHDVTLGSGSRLVGAGPGTVIVPPPRESYFALLVARGRGIRISNLALDGGGPGRGDGSAVAVFDGSSDVRIRRVRVTRVRRQGVSVWGNHADVSIQDAYIDGGGRAEAGVVALGSDDSRDTSVIRTRIRGFRDYGINFVQRDYDRPRAALHSLALDNEISDIDDPARADGTNEGGIWSGGARAALIGNSITRTGWDGIETVGSSTNVSVSGNDISRTPTGIYLEHATNRSLFMRNSIRDVRTGINVEWRYGGVGSSGNTFANNRIDAASETGLFIDVGSDRNRVLGNLFIGGALPAIRLQGSSGNRLERNRACGHGIGELVREQHGRLDDGRLAVPRDNEGWRNSVVTSCRV